MNISIHVIAAFSLVFSTIANAELSDELAGGTRCFVEFNESHPPCNGTLQRKVVYTVTYRADVGQWKVYGKKCDSAEHQTASYPGAYPGGQGIRKISMWGEMYEYDESGNLRHTSFGNSIGNVSCP